MVHSGDIQVLLVEDHFPDAVLLRGQLARSTPPVQLTLATRMEEALSALERPGADPFDVVLLDLFLPDSRGLDTVQRVVAAAPGLPIVVLTGLDDRELATQAMQAGAQDYLVKAQSDPHLLLRTMQYAIYRKKATAEQQRLVGELQRARDELEQRVQERTAELAKAVDELQAEVVERLRVEDGLRASELRFRQMAENLPQVFWMSNAELTQALYVNPMFEQVWQVPAQRLYDEPQYWVQTVHPGDRRRLLAKVRRAMHSPEGIAAFDEEFRIFRGDGAVRLVRARGFPVCDFEGRLQRICGTCEDVTDQRLAEEARLRLAAIVESSRDAILATDLEGTILSWNESASRLFGYQPQEAIGQPVTMLAPSGRRAEMSSMLQAVRRGGRLQAMETVQLRRNGKPVHVSVTASPVQDPSGNITMSMIIRDISENRRLQQEVLRISGMERRRTGQDLHDSLGQVLAGLAMMSQALARRLVDRNGQEAELAERIARTADEAVDVCRRLAHGLCPVEITAHGLPAGLKELAEQTEARFGISCSFAFDQDVADVDSTVANEVYLIALEAVTNAARHAQAGHIQIQLRQTGEALVLVVRDDGVGLPRKAQRRRKGMGLRIMHYRAAMIGAVLRSLPATGGGHQIVCTLHKRQPRRSRKVRKETPA